jgi:hypothetical protein
MLGAMLPDYSCAWGQGRSVWNDCRGITANFKVVKLLVGSLQLRISLEAQYQVWWDVGLVSDRHCALGHP